MDMDIDIYMDMDIDMDMDMDIPYCNVILFHNLDFFDKSICKETGVYTICKLDEVHSFFHAQLIWKKKNILQFS